MQFIESNVFGVRAAHYRLESPRHKVEIRLFPMIHIGAPDYYAHVAARLQQCEVVLFEGARSSKAHMLALSYSLATRRKRLGLVTEREALRLRSLGVRLIHADSTSDEFAKGWSGIPLQTRLALMVGAPLYGAWLFLTATRESLGQDMQTEDLESRDRQDAFEDEPELERTLLTRRDSRLIGALTSLLVEATQPTCAGVLYGAGHISAVTRFLFDEHAFRVVGSEWLDVMIYDR